jgi:hypothetical protein
MRTLRLLRISRFVFLVLLACTFAAHAHDIPNDVRVLAYVKPEGERLRVVVRVPMIAMREVDFPTRAGGYLDLSRTDPALRNAAKLWIVDNLGVYQNEERLAAPTIAGVRVSLPSDRSFESYDRALARFGEAKLPDSLELYWSHGLLDVLLDYPIRPERADFAIHPRFARLGLQVAVALKFVSGDAVRVFDLHGDPGVVRLDPRWHQAFVRFVELGFRHIIDGADHLVFLLCLVLPFRRFRALVLIATAFTAGHSITLVMAALGYAPQGLWFPPLVEMLIAATILYTALENIIGSKLDRRWLVAFLFGLVHGLGFSFGLRESLQLAGGHLVAALLAFNVGIELGQLAVLAVAVPALVLALRFVPSERIAIVIASAFVAHTAWHWMLERYETFAKFRIPDVDQSGLAQLIRWLILGLVITAFLWAASGILRKRAASRPAAKTTIAQSDAPDDAPAKSGRS